MGTTTNFGLPFPAYTDIPDGVAQMQALAGAVDTALLAAVKQVQRSGAGMSIPDSTFTTITGFGTPLIARGSTLPYGSGAVTVGVAGVYEASLYVIWPAMNTAHRTLARITLNGTETLDGRNTLWQLSGTTQASSQKVSSTILCAVGDVVSQQIWQNSGSTQTTVTDSAVFTVRRVG